MRTPFVRPLLSIAFYIFAGLTLLSYLIFGLAVMLGSTAIPMRQYGGTSVALVIGIAAIVAGVFVAGMQVAIGQFIEIIAKIEWNTRPNTGETGYVAQPSAAPSPHASLTGKKYYLREKGQERGPFNGPEVLALYQEGKVSFATTIYVEEDGQRRPLKNLSEINL